MTYFWKYGLCFCFSLYLHWPSPILRGCPEDCSRKVQGMTEWTNWWRKSLKFIIGEIRKWQRHMLDQWWKHRHVICAVFLCCVSEAILIWFSNCMTWRLNGKENNLKESEKQIMLLLLNLGNWYIRIIEKQVIDVFEWEIMKSGILKCTRKWA